MLFHPPILDTKVKRNLYVLHYGEFISNMIWAHNGLIKKYCRASKCIQYSITKLVCPEMENNLLKYLGKNCCNFVFFFWFVQPTFLEK